MMNSPDVLGDTPNLNTAADVQMLPASPLQAACVWSAGFSEDYSDIMGYQWGISSNGADADVVPWTFAAVGASSGAVASDPRGCATAAVYPPPSSPPPPSDGSTGGVVATAWLPPAWRLFTRGGEQPPTLPCLNSSIAYTCVVRAINRAGGVSAPAVSSGFAVSMKHTETGVVTNGHYSATFANAMFTSTADTLAMQWRGFVDAQVAALLACCCVVMMCAAGLLLCGCVLRVHYACATVCVIVLSASTCLLICAMIPTRTRSTLPKS